MQRFKLILFLWILLLLFALMGATVAEKLYGTEEAVRLVYASWWFIGLWICIAVGGFVLLLRSRVYRHVMTFSLHLSFLLILVGAAVTHFMGIQGRIHLRLYESVSVFTDKDGRHLQMPFSLTLREFTVKTYPGTSAPMDYVSRVTVASSGEERRDEQISMNQILTHRNYRFYQSGYDEDEAGTILSVAYDPAGIGLTYAGYLLLLVSLIGFFFQRESGFRRLWRHPLLRQSAFLCGGLLVLSGCDRRPSTPEPKVLTEEAAADFGELLVLYNDRICPLQTVARDFTTKLYGAPTYRGYTAEQVLTGWLFYFDSWKQQPMIRIKERAVRHLLGTEEEYVPLTAFANRERVYKLDDALRQLRAGHTQVHARAIEEANEKFNLVSMLCMGSFLRLYPLRLDNGRVEWFAQTDELPATLAEDRWLFVRRYMSLLGEQVAFSHQDEVRRLLDKLRTYQMKELGDEAPSPQRLIAEKVYQKVHFSRPFAMSCLTFGLISFVVTVYCMVRRRRPSRVWTVFLRGLHLLLFAWLSITIVLRGYVAEHLPLSNGFETMQFMAWCSLLLTFFVRKRFPLVKAFGLVLCGLSLLVAMLGEANPPITRLMPVLASPLLSIHVVIIMVAYSLLAFVMLNGLTALLLYSLGRNQRDETVRLMLVSQVLLYPAVFCLAAGIFIGAVWANQSWGRYWGWDPKEVWALITLLIYAFALHRLTIPAFRRPLFFHLFAVLAFLSVLITYFGVNFFLGGMHSYANG